MTFNDIYNKIIVMNDFLEKYNELLLEVSKPGRYTGGEYNTPNMKKPHMLKMCMCFPDVYEVAMSNIGISILYNMLNEEENILCERCYAPWVDLGDKLKENGLPLISIENKTPLKEFDVLGFSMQFELLYTNLLYMLDLAGIPFYSKDRDDSYPIIIAGGPCSINPEPFAPFVDVVSIGEGEECLKEFAHLVDEGKKKGLTKKEILKEAKNIVGIYVPSMHVEGERVKKAVVSDINESYYPVKPIVPNIEIVHDRVVLELYRGCASGCRFCQACFFYRPIREKSKEVAYYQATEMLKNTGYNEISLSSLSTGDYTHLNELIEDLAVYAEKHHVNLSLPSLRLNSYDNSISRVCRKSSLTFAPEAGTQRLRDVINKNITISDIENGIGSAFSQGYDSIKLYFMIGLPTETDEDLQGIIDICKYLKDLYYQKRKSNRLRISLSTAVFIPKPFTPFEFCKQITLDEMRRKQEFLYDGLSKIKGVDYHYHDSKSSRIEGILARGDQKLAKVIELAYKKGCRFCSWTEHFKYDKWEEAISEAGVNADDYLREYSTSEELCWDFIDGGVSKNYLVKEYEKALRAETTKNCRNGCNACGAMSIGRCNI